MSDWPVPSEPVDQPIEVPADMPEAPYAEPLDSQTPADGGAPVETEHPTE